MKNIKFLLALPGLLAFQGVFAQNDSHVKLSDTYPTTGEKITVTYDPAGTAVDGKKNIEAVVYYLGKKNSAADIDLKQDGNLLKGEIAVPDSARAFFVKISAEDNVDNNNEKGYFYMVYKDKQPVEGAYASNAYFLSSSMGNYLAKVKMDKEEGLVLYKKEFALYPQSEKENTYIYAYYSLLAGKPENKRMIDKKIAELEQSNSENDMMTASSLLRATRNTKAMDSLNTVIKTRFPNGTTVKNEMGNAFFREKDIVKKEELYAEYIKKYPESTTDKNTIQDNFRSQLALAYLEKGDMDNFRRYEGQLKNKSNLAGNLNNLSYEWAKKGEHLDEAEKLAKEAVDIEQQNIDHPVAGPFTSVSQAKKNAQYSYDMNADSYAFILAKEKKYDEALKYEQPVIDHSKTIDPDEYMNYVNILTQLGQYAKAKDAAEMALKDGKGTEAIKESLKTDYIKLKGSDAGYDQYLTSLENASKNKQMTEIAKTMINKPAPTFALKDLDGKTVALADLKGKTVIVDFWATWCGPCKASFPGMQLAVNKYKDDPNVKFLFVDCWETEKDYVPGVQKFVADNKYTFHVLIDEKGDDGRQSKVVSSYGVTGIPTKFVIDKNGNIRFSYVGYSGTPEKLLEEVTDMITLTNNPEALSASGADKGVKSK